jgi:Pyruvate phosphate dikinase, AMP/ATP-binding domain
MNRSGVDHLNSEGGERMGYVLDLREIDQTHVAVVGGKGALLGELWRIEGIPVPRGLCVTTDAFRRILAGVPSIDDRLDRLARLKPDGREAIGALSAEIRRALEGVVIPEDLAAAITRPLAWLGEQAAYAVRSSATAEDLPTASFAGQHDSYLNVVGAGAVLEHVSRCWASLFTERAVTYRLQNGFDQRKVQMAVVVQQMVVPQAAGILFTADPVTSSRKVASVEASFGLGDALVSGLVNADTFKVVRTSTRIAPAPLGDDTIGGVAVCGIEARAASRDRRQMLEAVPSHRHSADLILDVSHPRRVDGADLRELERTALESLEESLTPAEDHRDDREVDLINETRGQVLVDDGRATGQPDIVTLCGFLGPCERGLNAVRHELEDGAALHLEWLARMVGENEHRVVVGRVLAPPASPRVIRPLATDRSERVPAHDRRADVRPPLLQHRRAGVGFGRPLRRASRGIP